MTTLTPHHADLRVRTLAGGAAVLVIGIVFFLLTADMETANRLAWSWFIMATGFAGVIGSRLIGCRSRVARFLLWFGVAVFTVSIFVVKIGLTVAP